MEAERKRMKKQADEHNLQLEVEQGYESARRAARAHALTQQAIAAAAGQSRKTGAQELRAEELGQRNGATAFPKVAQCPASMPNPKPAHAGVLQPAQHLPSDASSADAPRNRPKPPATPKRKPTTKPSALTPSLHLAGASTEKLLDDFFNSSDD